MVPRKNVIFQDCVIEQFYPPSIISRPAVVGGRIYCCSSLAGRVIPLTFCSSRRLNLDINLGLLLLPGILVISLLSCARCCVSVCLPACLSLCSDPSFWGVMGLCPCLSQFAKHGEAQRGGLCIHSLGSISGV